VGIDETKGNGNLCFAASVNKQPKDKDASNGALAVKARKSMPLQDLLTHCLRGLGEVALAAGQLGIRSREADVFTCETLFSTLTNVNFDPECFVKYIQRAIALREDLKAQIQLIGAPENSLTSRPSNLPIP
jgi:hydroxylamine reductase (hybrid-cluster protein)